MSEFDCESSQAVAVRLEYNEDEEVEIKYEPFNSELESIDVRHTDPGHQTTTSKINSGRVMDETILQGSGFEYNLTSNANAGGDHDPHSLFSNMSPKSGTQCRINPEQIELSEFYLGLLQCEQDCETCQKYIQKLTQHIRAVHAGDQPTRDPLDTDESPAVQIKSEVDEDIERMDSSEESELNVESMVANGNSSESDPDLDYNTSHDLNSQRKSGRKEESESESDPDYDSESGSESDPDYIIPGQVRSTGKSRKPTITTHNTSQTGKMSSKIRFKCTVCEKSFSQKRNLDSHMRIHTRREKPFKCDCCLKGFSTKCYLKLHMRSHRGENRFKCSECEKSFPMKGGLDLHMPCHTGEKPFKCTECLKSFSRKGSLNVHKRIHRGENPFTCKECGKSFSQKGSLDRHMKCHTGEKPFNCTECAMSFSQKGSFNVHKMSHIGQREFKCTECERSFRHKAGLDCHMRSHTGGEKSFECKVCKKSFTTKFYLKIHVKSHSQKGHS